MFLKCILEYYLFLFYLLVPHIYAENTSTSSIPSIPDITTQNFTTHNKTEVTTFKSTENSLSETPSVSSHSVTSISSTGHCNVSSTLVANASSTDTASPIVTNVSSTVDSTVSHVPVTSFQSTGVADAQNSTLTSFHSTGTSNVSETDVTHVSVTNSTNIAVTEATDFSTSSLTSLQSTEPFTTGTTNISSTDPATFSATKANTSVSVGSATALPNHTSTVLQTEATTSSTTEAKTESSTETTTELSTKPTTESATTEISTEATTDLTTEVTTVPTVLGPPVNLTVSNISNSTALCTWTAPVNFTEDITSFVIRYVPLTSESYTCNKTLWPSVQQRKAKKNETTISLVDLQPWTTYQLNVAANSAIGEGENASVEFKTKESNPGPVINLTISNVTSNTATLCWLDPCELNGNITKYNVTTSTSGQQKEIETTDLCLTFDDLLSYHDYTFIVKAVNTVGNGRPETIQIQTDIGVPDKPEIKCAAVNSTSMNVTWTMTGYKTGPTNFTVTAIDDKDTNRTFECTTECFECTSCAISGLDEYWNYTVQVTAATSIGTASSEECNSRTEEDAPGVVSYFSVNQTGQFISIYWKPPIERQKNGEIREYSITWKAETGADKTFVNVSGIEESLTNIKLTSGITYNFTIAAITRKQGTEMVKQFHVETIGGVEEKSQDLTAVIGAVSGLSLALVIIAIVVLFLWRRQARCFRKPMKQAEAGEINDAFVTDELLDRRTSRPVDVSEFGNYYNDLSANTNLLFAQEYQDLESLSPRYPTSEAEVQETRIKNRYTNILPFNKTRVKLLPIEDEPGSDYINANYVPGYLSAREYIATQGPIASTINDFWRMIWEQNVSIIVMLTQCVERGRKKCEQYWPKDVHETFYYGDIIVQLESESHLPDFILRTFLLQVGDLKRQVRHYYYLLWPDMGTPACTDYMIRFVDTVRRDVRPDMVGPIVVHCSAGVGRTGTFITLDTIIRQIQVDDPEAIDIFGQIFQLRNCRLNMVQTESQFVYIYECIRDVLCHDTKSESTHVEEQIYENASVNSSL